MSLNDAEWLLNDLDSTLGSIEDAEKRLKELDAEAGVIKTWIQRRKEELFKERHGVGIGDLVRSSACGKVFRITSIEPRFEKWCSGVMQRKDGTFGTHEYNLYQHWEPLDA